MNSKSFSSLAFCALLIAALACNTPASRGTPKPAQEMPTDVVATKAATPVTKTPPTPLSSPSDGSNPESDNSNADEGNLSITEGGDIVTNVSIKDGDASFDGEISYPGDDSSDEITVKPVGFDSTITSGYLVFSLTCSGRGKAKVNYKGGSVESGLPGCGETWKIYVENNSPDSHITIRLDANGEVTWSLSVTGGE